MTATKTGRRVISDLLDQVSDLTDRINRCHHCESIGRGSPLSSLDTDIVARVNAREAWSDRQNLTDKLRAVLRDLITRGVSPKKIHYHSYLGRDLVGWVDGDYTRSGEFIEFPRPRLMPIV